MTNERDDADAIRQDFHEAVNTTPTELEEWLASEESQAVGVANGDGESVGHESGRRIVSVARKAKDDLDDEDLAHMRKVVGYVRPPSRRADHPRTPSIHAAHRQLGDPHPRDPDVARKAVEHHPARVRADGRDALGDR